MRVCCELMIVHKSVGFFFFLHPVFSCSATFPLPIFNNDFEKISADGSQSIKAHVFTVSFTFSTIQSRCFKQALIRSAYVERGRTESVRLKSPKGETECCQIFCRCF